MEVAYFTIALSDPLRDYCFLFSHLKIFSISHHGSQGRSVSIRRHNKDSIEPEVATITWSFKELTLVENLPKTNITIITTTEVTLGCNVTDRECHEELRVGATK